MPSFRILFSLCLLVAPCRSVHAQLPLSIDNLLVGTGTSHLSLRGSVGSGADNKLQRLGVQRDWRGHTLALRQGLGRGVEVNGALQWGDERLRDLGGGVVRSQVRRARLGASWRLRRADRWPALIASAGLERTLEGTGAFSGRSWLALESYYPLDPVVLSLRLSVDRLEPASGDGLELRQEPRWLLAPQVNFAVNERVTLISGFTVLRSGSVALPEQRLQGAGLELGWSLGAGFALGPRNRVFVSSDMLPGSAGASASVEWLYRFR